MNKFMSNNKSVIHPQYPDIPKNIPIEIPEGSILEDAINTVVKFVRKKIKERKI